MRVVLETEKDGYKVTIFHWNNKYLLKFEEGSLEQTYKINALDITNEKEVLHLLADQDFMQSVQAQFTAMSTNLGTAMRKILL